MSVCDLLWLVKWIRSFRRGVCWPSLNIYNTTVIPEGFICFYRKHHILSMTEMFSIYYQHKLNVTLCTDTSPPSYQIIVDLRSWCLNFKSKHVFAGGPSKVYLLFNNDNFILLASCPCMKRSFLYIFPWTETTLHYKVNIVLCLSQTQERGVYFGILHFPGSSRSKQPALYQWCQYNDTYDLSILTEGHDPAANNVEYTHGPFDHLATVFRVTLKVKPIKTPSWWN